MRLAVLTSFSGLLQQFMKSCSPKWSWYVSDRMMLLSSNIVHFSVGQPAYAWSERITYMHGSTAISRWAWRTPLTLGRFSRWTWVNQFPFGSSSSTCSGRDPLGIIGTGFLWAICPSCLPTSSVKSEDTHTHNHFMAPFSGTTQVNQCWKKSSSGLYGSREDMRGRHIDNAAGRHSIRTNQQPASLIPPFLRRMPFLPQPSQFILAWDRHQICWLAYPVAWLLWKQ